MSEAAEFRSRSPHQSNRTSPHARRESNSSISPSRGGGGGGTSPNHKPLWRRRREEAEADDYKERLSPHRKQSVSPHRERKNSWHEEDDADNDEYMGRAERAFAGLNRYEKKFKRYTPDAMNGRENKENEGPSTGSGKSTTPTRDRSMSPKPIEIENDCDTLIRRQKDIDYGKNTAEYQEFVNNVQKKDRLNNQPWTPDKYEKMTRRNWDKQTKIWRKQLHYWRDPKPVKELMTPGTSPCPSPHRRSSPERDNRSSARQLFNGGGQMDDCAMDGLGFKTKNEVKTENNPFANGIDQPSSGVQPILSQAALTHVKNENSNNLMMEEDNDDSRMSYENSEETEQLPSAFKKH